MIRTFERGSLLDASHDVEWRFGAETRLLKDETSDAEQQLRLSNHVVFLQLTSSLMKSLGARRHVTRRAVLTQFHGESPVDLHGRRQPLHFQLLLGNLFQSLPLQGAQCREQLLRATFTANPVFADGDWRFLHSNKNTVKQHEG